MTDREQAVIEAALAFLSTIDNITTRDFELGGDRQTREALRSALAALDAPPSGPKKWVVYSYGSSPRQLEVVCFDHETALMSRDNLRRQLPSLLFEIKEMRE